LYKNGKNGINFDAATFNRDLVYSKMPAKKAAKTKSNSRKSSRKTAKNLGKGDAASCSNFKGYCLAEKAKDRPMVDCQEVKTKSGGLMMKGKCGVCGSGMAKIMPKK
jgi:hypothetical protein